MQTLACLDHGNVLCNTRSTHGLTAVLPTANSDLAVPALAAKHRAIDILIPGRIPVFVQTGALHVLRHVLHGVQNGVHLRKVCTLSAIYVDTVLTQAGNAVAIVGRFCIYIFDLDILAAVVHHVVDVTGAGCRTGHTSRTY